MKKLIALLICIPMLALCACRPTPDEEYVVNKGDDKAEEIINQTALPVQNTVAPTDAEPKSTEEDAAFSWQEAASQPVFPERWEDIIDNPYKQIIIEADVISGDIEVYPVHLIARHSFTAEDIKNVGRVLFPDASGFGKALEVARSTITDAMADVMANEEMKEDAREAQLEFLQDMLGGSRVVDELAFETVSGFDEVPDGSAANCSVLLAGGTGLVYSSKNGVLLSRCRDGGPAFEIEMDPDSIDIEPELTLDKAIAYADAFINEAGLNGFELAASQHERMFDQYTLRDMSSGWSLKYVRTFGYYPFDANSMDIGDESGFDFGDDMVFAAEWPVERIELYVTSAGVITFSWTDPAEDTGVVNENVQLMDFDTLSATAKRLLTAAVKSPYWDEGYLKLEECILTVVPCQKKDSELAYMMPVWVLRFAEYYSMDGPVMAHFYTPGEQVKNGYDFTIAFNAIDGTRVSLP